MRRVALILSQFSLFGFFVLQYGYAQQNEQSSAYDQQYNSQYAGNSYSQQGYIFLRSQYSLLLKLIVYF